jgi:hypothetical protein
MQHAYYIILIQYITWKNIELGVTQHRKRFSLPQISLSLSRSLSSLCLCLSLSLVRFLSRCRSTCSFAKHPVTLTSILDIRFLRQQLSTQAHRRRREHEQILRNASSYHQGVCWEILAETLDFAGWQIKHYTSRLRHQRAQHNHPQQKFHFFPCARIYWWFWRLLVAHCLTSTARCPKFEEKKNQIERDKG